MKTITLIDTRSEIHGESIGTVISTHDTISEAFAADVIFQARMRDDGLTSHVRTKIVTLRDLLNPGQHVPEDFVL
jgi:hypothetical protein